MQNSPYISTMDCALPEMDALSMECFEELPEAQDIGEVAVRQAGGNTVPAHPQACPLHEDMAHYGAQPLCESPSQGLCCTEFSGNTDRGTVRCAALHATRNEQQPMVALVALQKREKLPPPFSLN